jgi:hypothetical protein
MSGKTIDNPKIYIKGLSALERAKKFPNGTYVLIDGKINIMKNNRPYFTNKKTQKIKHSVCYGKSNILECSDPECVFHIKSNQCRLRKYSSKEVIEADKLLREKLNNGEELTLVNNNMQHKLKVLNVLQQFINNYTNEKEEDYLRKVIIKLNKMLSKFNNKTISNLSFKKNKSFYDSNSYEDTQSDQLE